MFPVRRDVYPEAAAQAFVATVLPGLARWRDEMRARPATAILGIEQSVVEWTGIEHAVHRVRFL